MCIAKRVSGMSKWATSHVYVTSIFLSTKYASGYSEIDYTERYYQADKSTYIFYVQIFL